MKTRFLLLASTFTACLAASFVASTGTAFAAEADGVPPSVSSAEDRTASGHYRSSDGTSGTYAETFTVAGDVRTDTIVYTPQGSTATLTEKIVVTKHTDGTRTVVETRLAAGATVASTFTTTLGVAVDGATVGTGTFTLANGTTGKVLSLVYKDNGANVTSAEFTTAAGVTTRELNTEERGNGGDSEKTFTVSATGALTVVTITRFGGMHHHHL